MSEDMCPICDGKMLHQDGKKFCPCQFLPPVRRGFLPAYGCDMRRRHRWGPDEIRHDRRALGFEDGAKESEDMTDVREQLTKTIAVIDGHSGEGTTATGDLLRAARDRIDAQDTKIAKLEEKLAELRPLVDDAWSALDSREDAPMLVNLDGLQEVVGRMKEVIEHE